MKKSVVIIGAGEIGSAIGYVLKKKKEYKIFFKDKDFTKVKKQLSFEELIPFADYIFLCVPSCALSECIKDILPFLNSKTIIISLPKGIQEQSFKTMDEILKYELPKNQPYGLLGGPLLAEELLRDLNGYGIVGSSSRRVFVETRLLFKETPIHLEYSKDVHGVALCSVLKNIYAIGLGIIDGGNLGNNQRGYYISKSLEEMSEIVSLLGGKRRTLNSVAGIGDFIATGLSDDSSNHELGVLIGQNKKVTQVSEGYRSIPSLMKLLKRDKKKFVMLMKLDSILFKKDKDIDF